MMVPVRSLDEVRGLSAGSPNVAALNRACRSVGTECVMASCRETERDEATVHARVFAPLLDIPEDPAAGSANGALGAYLVHHSVVPPHRGPTTTIVSEQGAEMGRPSTVYVEVDHRDGAITAVRVGGEVVLVVEGVARL